MSNVGANVFVTGANRGIGLGIVRELLKRPEVKRILAGARNPNDAKDLQQLARDNKKIVLIQIDLSNDESIDKAVQAAEKVVGSEGLNVLVNNAGIIDKSDQPITRKTFRDIFETNVIGTFQSTKAFLPLLEKGNSPDKPSKILNISSTLGSVSSVQRPEFQRPPVAYCSSKAALNMVTKLTSMSEKNVIVVAMCPGWVQTDMGGPNAQLTLTESTTAIVESLSKLGLNDTGRFVDRNGLTIPY